MYIQAKEVSTSGKSRYSKRVELKTPTYEGFLWIGLKKEGDQWKWSDDSPSDYTFWHPEEPNGGENENCAEVGAFSPELERRKGELEVSHFSQILSEEY